MSMTLCPRCGTEPSRRVMTGRGRAPLCLTCMAAKWKDTYARRVTRRWTREGDGAEDISAAEIERRYQVALRVIRRRQAQEAR